jgi:subtilisin-like proprotein convertase family protein
MTTFTNSTGVTFLGPVFTTSQTVTVSGLSGPLATISVTFTGLSHNVPDDLDFLLVAPDGVTNLLFWSDAFGAGTMNNVTITVADSGATALTNSSPGPTNGSTYKPADYTDVASGEGVETGASFGIPAVTLNHATDTGTATFTSVFTGYASPNGVWTLYLKDDAAGDGGSLTSWSLNITSGSVSVIGDKVFEDLNGNGIQDSGEPGVDGVTVQLLDTSNAVVQTTTTATGGLYSFANVADGTYSVKFITPVGTNYTFTSQDVGGNDALDSDVNASGQTAQFAVAGSNITNIDAGLRGTHVGGRVFGDLDHDGIRGVGETNVDGVTVRLLDSGNATVATTTTANGGIYDFANVTPGTYSVEFVAPSGFSFGPKDAGGDDTLDSDANASNPNIGRTDQFTVALGETINSEDAGIYATSGFGTFTFTNAAGVSFPSASANQTVQTLTVGGVAGPIAEIKVHINGLTHNLPDDLDFWLVGPDGTSNLLFWSDAGGITASGPVNIVVADSGASLLPNTGGLSSGTFKPSDYTDATEGVETAGSFGAIGTVNHAADTGTATFATAFTGLSPNGTWTLYARDDSGGDAGSFSSWSLEFTTASVSVIGDKVFEDLNGNGLQDSNEPGVDGITVQLLNSVDAVVDTTTTANGGLYHFTNVADGTYSVKFVVPGGLNYTFTDPDVGGDDALDSDANASGQTAQFAVAASNVTNIDAGLKGTHIGNKVFGDLDHDGIQDAGESGLDGVVVHLLDSGNATVATTVTANGGIYDFANVTPGTYSVKVDLPSQFSFSPQDAPSATDLTDSDVDTATGQTAQFSVALGQTVDSVDAGVYATAGVGTFTFTNNTGATFPAQTPLTLVQTLSIGGVAGGISDIKVHINGVSHNLPDDLDFLLVGPDGTHNLLFWSDAGGNAPSGGPFNIIVSDSGASVLPDSGPLSSGTFKPADYTPGSEVSETAASFGASGFTINHATTTGSATFASAFSDISPNGTWTLYLRDDSGGDAGSLTSWSLEITTVVLDDPPVVDLNGAAGGTGVTLAYTENDPATVIAPEGFTTDSDSTDYNGGSLTVHVGSGGAQDQLAILDDGSAVTVSGGIVSVGGLAVGTVSGGANGADLVVAFNTADATSAAISTLITHITYANSSEDPAASRTITFTVDDGDGATGSADATVTITGINDEPTLTATAVNPTFTEGGAAADLFTLPIVASTVEAAQTFSSLTLTVTNVTDGSNELLRVNGVDVALTNGSSVNVGVGTVNVVLSSGTATVTLSDATLTASQLQTLIDALSYRNESDDPTDANRVVTITQVVDSGPGTAPDDNTTTLSISSTVDVNPVDDEPTLTAAAVNPTFTEGDASPVDIFTTPIVASTVEAGQTFTSMTLTVTNVSNGASEVLGFDGSDIELADGTSVTTAAHNLDVSVSVSGTTATVTFSGATLSASDLQTLIDGLGYSNSSDDPGAADRVVTITQLVDSGSNASPNDNVSVPNVTSTIHLVPINDEPTLTATGADPAYAENSAPATLFSGAVASTVEAAQTFTSMTLTVSGLADGAGELLFIDGSDVALVNGNSVVTATNGLTVNVSVSASTATVTFSGAALSATALQTLVNGLGYSDADDMPTEGSRTITITQVVDSGPNGGADDNTALLSLASTVTVSATDDAPVLTGFDDTPAFIENGSSVVLDTNGNMAVSDPELDVSPNNYDGATLTIARHGGANAQDAFSTTSVVDLVDVNIDGENVSLDGGATFIGTYVNPADGSISFTFNANATAADIATVMQQIIYSNTSDNPPATVQVDFTFDDGSGQPGGQPQGTGTGVTTASVTVNITQVDDAPVLLNVAPTAAYAIGSTGVLLSNTLVVFDADATPPSTLIGIDHAQVKITNFVLGDELKVNLPTSGGFFIVDDGSGPIVTNISVQSNASGILILGGQDTTAHYQAVLDAVMYLSTAPDPSNGGAAPNRTITWQVSDGLLNSQTPNINPNNLVNATVLHFDQTPVVDLDASAGGTDFTTTYTENAAAIAIANADATIIDPDNAALDKLIVTLTNAKAGDVLSIDGTLPGGIDATIDTSIAGKITIRLINSASLSDYGTALKAIHFVNTSDDPDTADRDITVVGSEGTVDSNIAHTTIHVTAVNDAPVAASEAVTGKQNSAITGTVHASDPDGPSQTFVQLTDPAHGALVFDPATGTFTYTPDSTFIGTDSFTFKANDGLIDSNVATETLHVTPVEPNNVIWAGSPDYGSRAGAFQVAALGDFNGDGTDDVLWYDPSTHAVDQWVMHNGQWSASIDLGTHSAAPVGAGDFNGDGIDDILWRNPTTGAVDQWQMQNGQWAGSIDLGSHGTDWTVVGIGDFNQDGTDDILWRNVNTGQIDEWQMKDGQWSASVDLGSHGVAWQVVGVGDFDHNGAADILFHNAATGQLDEWRLDNGQWAGSVDLGTHARGQAQQTTDWQVAGIGDFNRDGTDDIFWHDPHTGANDAWVMFNGQYFETAPFGPFDPAFNVAGIGNLDGVGGDDLLWRNPTTGQTGAWLLAAADH